MNIIEGWNLLNEHGLRLADFSAITELHYESVDEQKGETIASVLEMVLITVGRSPDYQVIIQFTGVSNSRFQCVGNGMIYINGFDIINISEKQWENIKWEVVDYENDILHIYAKVVRVLAVERIAR